MITIFIAPIVIINAFTGLSRGISEKFLQHQNDIEAPPNIKKACGALKVLQLYGVNYDIPNPSDAFNAHYKNVEVNETGVHYTKHYTGGKAVHRMPERFVGTFFAVEGSSETSQVYSGVTVHRQGSEKKTRFVLYFSDYQNCSILGVHKDEPVSQKQCRLLVTPAVHKNGLPGHCKERFEEVCGQLKLWNLSYDSKKTHENEVDSNK